MKRLISIKELFELMNSNEKYVILDCRFDLMNKSYGIDAYRKGHIKGAYLMNIEKDLNDPVAEHGGRHPFRNHEDFKALLESYGIDNDTTVITYDDGDMAGAGRLVFQLNNLGLTKAYALDGGLKAYENNKGEIETKENTPEAITGLVANPDDSFMVDMEYVKSKLYNEDTIILDSRSNPRYKGEVEPVDKKAGHIPSAKSYFFKDVLIDWEDIQDSSFISIEELKKHFADLSSYKEVIVYCGSGISLMVNALALDLIGQEYKIYPGSFSDWISYEENKVNTEEE